MVKLEIKVSKTVSERFEINGKRKIRSWRIKWVLPSFNQKIWGWKREDEQINERTREEDSWLRTWIVKKHRKQLLSQERARNIKKQHLKNELQGQIDRLTPKITKLENRITADLKRETPGWVRRSIAHDSSQVVRHNPTGQLKLKTSKINGIHELRTLRGTREVLFLLRLDSKVQILKWECEYCLQKFESQIGIDLKYDHSSKGTYSQDHWVE